MRATHEFKTLLYFSKDFQSSPSSQADMLDGDIPLDSCLADRPHRHGCYCSSDGKSPERVSDCGIWIKAMKRDTRQVIKKKNQYGIREIKSSSYSLEHCQPLSVFIHFNYVSKSPSGVDTHNAQRDETRQHKNEMKCISPYDSLKTSLSLEINNKKSTSLSEQKFHQLQLKKKNRKIK